MTENQLLVLILCLVYLSECCCWVSHTSYAFQFCQLGKGQAHPPGKGLGNAHGRFVLARLLPFRAGLHVVPLHGGSFDTAAAQAHWQTFQQDTKWLGRCAVLSFLMLFLLIPTVWQLYGAESRVMLATALTLLVVNFITAALYFKVHPKYHPGDTWDRWQHSLFIALVPTHTSRARDTLGRKLLQAYHPLAVAAFALPGDSFKRLAERWLRQATYPLPGKPQAADLPALAAFLQPHNIVLTAPAASDEATQYCPRCTAQFGPTATGCSDCEGLKLEALGVHVSLLASV
jgi:hypothetical protein